MKNFEFSLSQKIASLSLVEYNDILNLLFHFEGIPLGADD